MIRIAPIFLTSAFPGYFGLLPASLAVRVDLLDLQRDCHLELRLGAARRGAACDFLWPFTSSSCVVELQLNWD